MDNQICAGDFASRRVFFVSKIRTGIALEGLLSDRPFFEATSKIPRRRQSQYPLSSKSGASRD